METMLREKKILIVDDEKQILELLTTVLKKEGFKRIYTADNGTKGLKIFRDERPDIIILDVMLPDKEGYEVCKEIRQTSNIPILFLSARTEEFDRVLGFMIGGDDYISKPFSPKEVLLRIKVNLKKNIMINRGEKDKIKILEFGPFKIDSEKLEVTKNGEIVNFKPKEFKMFLYMANHLNHIISKEKFCDEVWGEEFIGFDNTIMVHIRKLREKIEDDPSNPKYIINVKGLGYKLNIKDN